MSLKEEKTSQLAAIIEKWVYGHNTTWTKLFQRAGIPISLITQVKKGSSPQSDTLQKLSAAMEIPTTDLLRATGRVIREQQAAYVSDREAHLLSLYRAMDEEKQVTIVSVAEGFLAPPSRKRPAQRAAK